MRFDRLTERAQDGAMRAYEVMKRCGHSQVDVEHVFLALLEQPKGLIPELLSKLGASVETMRERLADNLQRAPLPAGPMTHPQEVAQVFITPRFKRVIDQATEEARLLEDEYVSTEHLLLGILSERVGFSANLLREARVTRQMVLNAIEQGRSRKKPNSPQAENRYRTIEKDPVTEDPSTPISVEPNEDKSAEYMEQQRQLLNAFRSATVVRSKADADADACYKAEQQEADADHQRVHELAKAQRTAAENTAQARRKSEELAVETSFSQAQQTAATKWDEVARAQEAAHKSLAWMGQTALLMAPVSITRGSDAGDNPADKLTHSAETATKAADALGDLAQALYQEGQAQSQARQRRRVLLYAGIAIIFVGVISILTNHMFRREEARSQATATAQAAVVETRVAAETAVVHATATAQAATREATMTAVAVKARAEAATRSAVLQITATAKADSVQATATAMAPVLARLQEQTGMEMVHVPDTAADVQRLPSFWIDRTEVTVAQYHRCVAANACTIPGTSKGCTYDVAGKSDHPITCINWHQAVAYCAWANKRLPDENEWEKAARGTDGRIYPWGNAWDPDKVNSEETSLRVTTAVGSYPAGASPYGALDMAGNVWEWVANWYSGSERVHRGGSFFSNATGVQVTNREGWSPDLHAVVIGFRCAYSP